MGSDSGKTNRKTGWKRRALESLPVRLQSAIWSVRRFRWKFGCWPNLIKPQKFNEMIVRAKIFDRDPRIVRLADKLLVKEYVRERLGDDWVIPTLWSGERLPPREQRIWFSHSDVYGPLLFRSVDHRERKTQARVGVVD